MDGIERAENRRVRVLFIGFDDDEAREAIEDVCARDEQRVELELVGGIEAGRSMMRGNMVMPEPEPKPFFPAHRRKEEAE